ncbi:MAG: Uma2 family endonuclease, partial [Planctomycetota bacterium]
MATDTIAPAPKSSAPDFTLTIPPIGSLDDFRRWMLSDEFPERGKIDFHRGRLEIDMSPQSLGDHGEVVAALIATLFPIVRDGDLGSLSDHVTRVSLPTADLSCEPDIVFVSHESLESGRVRETPKADRPSTGVEFVGPPDLLVEVVSDSSFDKDVNRYRDAYERAGVNE